MSSLNRYAIAVCVSVLSLCSGLSSGDIVITGVVRDAGTNLPIAEAIVTLQATHTRTTTNLDGTYALSIPDLAEAVIVAASKGYYNKSEFFSGDPSNLDFAMPMVPHDNDPNYQFMAPESCGVCHPHKLEQWQDSPMADAGINTWVHDIFNGTGTPGGMGGFVYTRDSAFAKSNPTSECASCHQPESWIPDPFTRMENPTDPGYPSIAATHGISCDVCHKVANVEVADVNFPGIFPGIVEYTRPQGPAFLQVQYGGLGDVDFSVPGAMRASYQPQLRAEVCATCHQDAADPDENHSYTGVISEPTYLEWAASAYADENSPSFATCLDCHMPPTGETQVSPILDLGRDESMVHNHTVLGSTPEYLENAADLTAGTAVVGSELRVDVNVANLYTGHHLPTGVTVRNMILLVEAWDETTGEPLVFTGDQVIHDLGGIGDPAQGYYAGLPGRFYAKVNHDANGNGPTFFTDAAGITFDNRIPALAIDNSSYSFAIPASATVRVRTRLIYRRAFRMLVDAKGWTQDGHGQPLADVAGPNFGYLMESTDVTISVCIADLTGDGVLNFFDVSAFLNAFGAGDPSADFTGDGNFDFFDVSAFLNAFSGGCP
jgi:Carboxypeptidase regulatory-like domain